MRTAIVSDLHLGSGFGEDLLRDAAIRRVLLDELAEAERVVLLGDVLELRELPLAAVLESARPFFEELGEAMAGPPVSCSSPATTITGSPSRCWSSRRSPASRSASSTAPSQPARPATDRGLARRRRAADRLPGIWLRDDVYATHGHYMDCHMSLPRLECIAAAATMRTLRPLPGPPRARRLRARAAARLRPHLRPRPGRASRAAPARPSERAWRAIMVRNGNRSRAPPRRPSALARRRPADLGHQPAPPRRVRRRRSAPVRSPTAASPRRPSSPGASTLERRHVITGHTHRGGPEEGEAEWPLPGGGLPPQHRQLGLRLGLPPSRHAPRSLLARHGHLARGRGSATPHPPAAGTPSRRAARRGLTARRDDALSR